MLSLYYYEAVNISYAVLVLLRSSERERLTLVSNRGNGIFFERKIFITRVPRDFCQSINTRANDSAPAKKYPRFETFCRTGMEKMMGEKQSQLAEFIVLKPEQRYLKLQEERPDLLNRVPQFQIASYLGIKPETLSRIRKRLVKS